MKKAILMLLCPIILGGCTWLVDFDEDTFNAERAAWKSQRIVNYAVTQSFSSLSFGHREARIVVENKVITQKENLGYQGSDKVFDMVIVAPTLNLHF